LHKTENIFGYGVARLVKRMRHSWFKRDAVMLHIAQWSTIFIGVVCAGCWFHCLATFLSQHFP